LDCVFGGDKKRGSPTLKSRCGLPQCECDHGLLGDSACGTNADAGKAIDASVFVANGFIILHAERTGGANFHASGASNASVFIDLDGHGNLLVLFFTIVLNRAVMSSKKTLFL